MVDELFLEVIDLAVAAHVFGFGREALDPFNQHATIPAAIEDRERPARDR